MILQSLLFSTLVFASSPSAVRLNNKAADALRSENYYSAYPQLLEALKEEPFNAVVKFNLGLNYELNEDPERAIKEYMAAAKLAKNKVVKFSALFNLARLHGEQKNIDVALNYYQKALAIDPNSVEVKTNIELLTKNGGQGSGEQNQDPQQGEGGGDQQQQQQKGQNDKQDQNQAQQPQKQKRKFNSQKLSQDDVRKILEELKNQEQKIRAKEYEKGAKESANGKNW